MRAARPLPPHQPQALRHRLALTTTGLMTALWLAGASPVALAQAPAAQPAASAASAPAPALRPEAAKPLLAAQEAFKAGKAAEALQRLAEAEAVPGLTPYEDYVLRRLKGPALLSAGQPVQALPLLEGLLDDRFLPAGDRWPIHEVVIRVALEQKDYPRAERWMKRYIDGNGPNAELRRLYPQVQAMTGNHAGAAAGFQAQVAAEDAAGRAPAESLLRLLASSQRSAGDDAGYGATLERLAAVTGQADYWAEVIQRATQRPGFSTERLALDVYRLRRAVGVPLSAGELGDMAQRANQAGLPTEAQQLLDEGFNSGLLGKDANAAADRRLREQATKAATQDRASAADGEAALRNAKDGNAGFGLGLALSGAGLHERALALMTQAQAKGGLRRPDDAQLHLGLAQWRAGQVDAALKSFATVSGSDGTAELARLWTAFLKNPPKAGAR